MKKAILFLLVVVMALSLTLVACDNSNYEIRLDQTTITLEKGESIDLPYHLFNNGEADTETKILVSIDNDVITYDQTTGKITAQKVGQAVVTLSVEGYPDITANLTVKVPTYTVAITGGDSATVNLGDTENITYTVQKDGLSVTGMEVTVTVTGDALQYTSVGNRLSFVAEGTGTVTVALKKDPTVSATKTYTVIKSFWSSEYEVNKNHMTITDDQVTIPGGGNQYFLGVMDGGTQYVFRATLSIPAALPANQSVGLGHTTSKNDNSLWFGLQGLPSGAGYRVYIKNFYNGWSTGTDIYVADYTGITFDSAQVEFIIVRDGQNYWYSIGGLIGTYTDTSLASDVATHAGVYSQENSTTVTNFSYSATTAEIDAAKEICSAAVARFDIVNKGVNSIVKGSTFTYVARAIGPVAGNIPAVEWELDKTQMTAGADGTTINNGVLTVADDAVGTVKVIAKCGGKTAEVDVAISQESLRDENQQLIVDGGVILNDDGSVVFSPDRNGNNPTLDYTQYTDVFYSAKLKTTVKGDFSVAFTLSNLLSNDTPTFMLSLGGRYGNLVFSNNKVSIVGLVFNSNMVLSKEGATVEGNFAEADTLRVVVSVIDGKYAVKVNDVAVQLTSIRRLEDYTADCPVLMTVLKGTSCVVSDIVVTDSADDADIIILNDNTVAVTDGFATTFGTYGWNAKEDSSTATYYGNLLPEGNYTVKMNVKFSHAMTDSKLAIMIGNWEYHINNKLLSTGVIEGQLRAGNWDNAPSAKTTIATADNAIEVTLKKVDSTMYFYIGGKLIASYGNDSYKAPEDRLMTFFAFNEEANTASATATVTNLSVEQGAVIISIQGTDTLQVGTSATYSATVIGSTQSVVWSLNTDALTAGEATLDADGLLTLSNNADGSVTVIATLGDITTSYVVTISQQPADQNTAIAESKGGVKQDAANGTISFDDAGKNGVADENNYSESSTYYAILNSAQGTRATITDNFVVQFTVSNYVTTADYPKFMISLGGRNEQFYVVYFKNGTAQIQTYTQTISSDGVAHGGQWVNSAMFANFDTTQSHTYRIECVGGVYNVYVDDVLVTGWNMDGQSRTLIRNPEDMAKPHNIMMSTNGGTTCDVSAISVTTVEGTTTKYLSDKIVEQDGNITMAFPTVNWGSYDVAGNLYTYGAVSDNCTITFDLQFNDNMTDAKFCVKLDAGINAYTICLNNGTMKVEVRDRWGGSTSDLLDYTKVLKVKITIVDGSATMTINDTYTVNNGVVASQGIMSFCTFNENGGDAAKTATVSNIVVVEVAQ